MFKKILIFVIFLLLIIFITPIVAEKYFNFDILDLFKEKNEITIEDTKVLVDEVKNIAELCSQSYYNEEVLHISETNKKKVLFVKYKTKKELVIIAKGHVRAGFDLSKIDLKDILYNKKDHSIYIEMPQAKILDVIVNPSGFNTFIEKGKFTFDEISQYKEEARELLKQKAIENKILEKSEEYGYRVIRDFFYSLGFKKVIVKKSV